VLPRRWVVDRSFGWLGRSRRLCRDFEHTTVSSEAMGYLASIRHTLRVVTTEKSN
jgi:putative transposase